MLAACASLLAGRPSAAAAAAACAARGRSAMLLAVGGAVRRREGGRRAGGCWAHVREWDPSSRRPTAAPAGHAWWAPKQLLGACRCAVRRSAPGGATGSRLKSVPFPGCVGHAGERVAVRCTTPPLAAGWCGLRSWPISSWAAGMVRCWQGAPFSGHCRVGIRVALRLDRAAACACACLPQVWSCRRPAAGSVHRRWGRQGVAPAALQPARRRCAEPL